jgi:DNA-binding MarR family transcriptional regulator
MLTSHELGFYRQFAHKDKVNQQFKTKKEKQQVQQLSAEELRKDYLWTYLKQRAHYNEVSVTQKELAKDLGVSIQTIRRKQQRLERAGFLKRIEEANAPLNQPIRFKLKK